MNLRIEDETEEKESLLSDLPYFCSTYVEIVVLHLTTVYSIDTGYKVAVEPRGDHVQVTLEINEESRCVDIGLDPPFNGLEQKLLGFVDDFIEYLYGIDQTKAYEQGRL